MDSEQHYADSDEEDAAIDAAAVWNFPLEDIERSYDMMAVFVIEDVPNEVRRSIIYYHKPFTHSDSRKAVARFLDANSKHLGFPCLWLVDTYENLPAFTGKSIDGQTEVDSSWRSPFVGKSLDEVARFVVNIDRATKAIDRSYFAVLRKPNPAEGESDYNVLVCKTPNEAVGRTDVQTTVYQRDAISGFFVAFDEDNWEIMMEDQAAERLKIDDSREC